MNLNLTKSQKRNYEKIIKWSNDKLLKILSTHINSTVFNPQSFEAAKRTIDLAFKIGCKCSIVFFKNGYMNDICKLDAGTVSNPIVAKQLSDFGITPQKHRILQCIIKEYTPPKNRIPVEYEDELKKVSGIIDGLYVFILSDMPLLHKDGLHPWPMVLPQNLRNIPITPKPSINTPYLPVFNSFSMDDCLDIAIPTYDDITAKPIKNIIPWNKRKSIAVFRGSSTGCGTTVNTNPRLKVSNLKLSENILNAGITSYGKSPRFDPIIGISKIKPGQQKSFMTQEEISQYKYTVHIDGNVAAYRLAQMMRLGCLQLIINGPYHLWYSPGIIHGKTVIITNVDQLEAAIKWCQANDTLTKAVADNGAEFANSLLGLNNIFIKLAIIASTSMPTYLPSVVLENALKSKI